ncbi:MAG: type III-B CRISPR module-associated protein Cmr3 [Marinisporobacter sp.]|nr:type III-B CRISPR module-associated protein Cmr3 [Marinisporobacter sp.]
MNEEKMHVLKIKPNDNLFLGDGKRFDKGESTWLESRLMPYPSVFYGSICSLMLQLNQKRSNRYINDTKDKEDEYDDPRKSLTIRNIYLYDEENRDVYMKAPLDLFINKYRKCRYGSFKKLEDNVKGSIVNGELNYFLFNDKKNFQRVEDLYIKKSSFENGYFYDREIDFYGIDHFVTKDYKVGIQRKNGMAEEEHLYRIDLTQFNDRKWSYLVEYNIKDEWWKESPSKKLEQGYLKLGGENKSCKYWDVSHEEILKKDEEIENYKNLSNRVKIYISAPFISKKGFLVDFKESKESKQPIKVLGVSNKKPLFIGGYDMRAREHKPMYKAIPEGSIYLLESEAFQTTIKEIKEYIKDQMRAENSLIKSGFNQFEIIPYRMIEES